MARRVKLDNSKDQAPIVKSDLIPEIVTYSVFFHECLIRGLVKSWQENEIYEFFKSLGLQEKEQLQKYKDALAKY